MKTIIKPNCSILKMKLCLIFAVILTGTSQLSIGQSYEWQEQQKILSAFPSAAMTDGYGSSVAVDGNYAIVGIPAADVHSLNSGKVVILEKDGAGVWTEIAEIYPPSGTSGDQFGTSVDIDGDYAVVGAPYYGFSGAVGVIKNNEGTWSLDTLMQETSFNFGEYLGHSVAIEGSVILAGDVNSAITFNTGSVSVYMRDNTDAWNREARILKDASIPLGSPGFGRSVDFENTEDNSGNPILRAAIGHHRSGIQSAYVYEMSWADSTWSFLTELTPSSGTSRYGSTISIEGTRILVGDPTGPSFNRGQAFLFEETAPNIWTETQLFVPVVGSNSGFASSMDIQGSQLLFGAPGAGSAGEAWIYSEDSPGVWSLDQRISSDSNASFSSFGAAVCFGAGEIFVGSPSDSELFNSHGAVHVFREALVAGNEDCSSASPISASEFGTPGWENYVLGQSESMPACPDGGDADDDIWFSFVAQSPNDIIIAQALTLDLDLAIEVFESCGGPSLACFSNYGSGETERAAPGGLIVGNTYFFRVYDTASDLSPGRLIRVAHKTYADGGLGQDYCDEQYILSNSLYAERDDLGQLYNNPAVPVKGYRFRFQELGGGLDLTYTAPEGNPWLTLANVPGLSYGKSYEVSVEHRVRMRANGTFNEFWSGFGTPCTIHLANEVPSTRLRDNFCNATELELSDLILAEFVNGADQYEFIFMEDGNTLSTFTPSYSVLLYSVDDLEYAKAYEVTVRARVEGLWSEPGAVCSIGMAAAPPPAEVQAPYCGGTYLFPNPNFLLATQIYGAEEYMWRFTPVSGGLAQETISPGLSLALHTTDLDLSPGQYNVEAKAKAGGVYNDYGTPCTITIGGGSVLAPLEGDSPEAKSKNISDGLVLNLYPNPNDGSGFFIQVNGSMSDPIDISIYDGLGRLLDQQRFATRSKDNLWFAPRLSLSSGHYFIQLSAGEHSEMIQLIVD